MAQHPKVLHSNVAQHSKSLDSNVAQQGICDMEVNDEEDSSEWGEFADELTGKLLDPAKVREARLEELTLMRKILLYDKVSVEECWANTSRAPISTK